MAHGPDTEELLRRIANIQNGQLTVNGLNITSLPPLPSDLKILKCSHTRITSIPELPFGFEALNCFSTPITSLPELPSTLEGLNCAGTQITSLPDSLPPNLEELYCDYTEVTTLPKLPPTLKYLSCNYTQITVLPELPSNLQAFACHHTPLIIPKRDGEKYAGYNARWNEWREEQASKKRCQERSKAIHEELVAAAWAPSRVEKWIEIGGFDLLDSL